MKVPPKDERSCCVDKVAGTYVKRHFRQMHLHHTPVGGGEGLVRSPPSGLLQSHCVMMTAFLGSSDEMALEKLNSLSAQGVR